VFLVVENNHPNDDIWLVKGSSTQYPVGLAHEDSSRWIKPETGGVYRFASLTNLNTLSIRHNTASRPLPNITCITNHVYTIRYDGNDPVLFSETLFDPTIKNKIWTIPTSTATGRYFSAGLFVPRDNLNDGYILTGRSNYSIDTVARPTVGSVGYLGMLMSDGSFSVEKKITLTNAPASFNVRSFIENSGGLIFAGQSYEEDADGFPFILNTDLNGTPSVFYADFIKDIDPATQALYGNRVVKNDAGYALGAELYDYNRGMSQIYIAAISQANWDTAQHTELWRSPETDDVYFTDLKYDAAQQTYIVLAGDYQPEGGQLGSYLYFVGADGVQKSRVRLDRYEIRTIFTLNNEFYVAGTYMGASGYRGIINKLDVNAGTFGPSPWLVDSRYTNGVAAIVNTVLETDGTIVLGGYCLEDLADQGEWWLTSKPWLIKYDLTASKKIWEEIYDYPGCYIYSVHHNAIGSYLIETYNSTTYESLLISTDLMGKASGNRLAAIPRDTATFTAAAPGTPRISAEFTPLTDASLSTEPSLTVPKGQSATITAAGTWSAYQWYVDGVLVSGAASSQFIFTTAARNPGLYNVTLVVTGSNGEKRSARRWVTVTN
jgi:hypothetical protein